MKTESPEAIGRLCFNSGYIESQGRIRVYFVAVISARTSTALSN